MTTWNSGSPVPNPSNTWTNDPVVGDVTEVRAQHMEELRQALEYSDGHYHFFNGYTSGPELPDVSVSWSDPTITANSTKIRANHWLELRTYIEDFDGHYHNVPDIGYNSTTFDAEIPGTWSTGMAAGEKPKKDHIDELRHSIGLLHDHTHSCCCDAECPCQCTCTCQCQEDCCSECWMWD
jgi:hypothetical protein